MQSVNKVFSGKGCVEGPDQEIEFAEDKITLEITESGLVMQDGWSIIPLTPLTVEFVTLYSFWPAQLQGNRHMNTGCDRHRLSSKLTVLAPFVHHFSGGGNI